jgi:hypothetical protein
LFTAPDTDKLHDAFGITNSVAGKVVKGSDGFGANPNAVAVTHIFSSPKCVAQPCPALRAPCALVFDSRSEV